MAGRRIEKAEPFSWLFLIRGGSASGNLHAFDPRKPEEIRKSAPCGSFFSNSVKERWNCCVPSCPCAHLFLGRHTSALLWQQRAEMPVNQRACVSPGGGWQKLLSAPWVVCGGLGKGCIAFIFHRSLLCYKWTYVSWGFLFGGLHKYYQFSHWYVTLSAREL